MRTWNITGTDLLFEHPLLRAERRELLSPTDGTQRQCLALAAPDWTNVVAVTDADEVVLVRQWRFAIGDWTLEIPGGIVDPGEDALEAARRELLEETGYRATHWQPLGWVHPNPAILTNRCPTWLATGLSWEGPGLGDGEEEIEVVTVPSREIPRLVASGRITHALVIAALYLLEHRR